MQQFSSPSYYDHYTYYYYYGIIMSTCRDGFIFITRKVIDRVGWSVLPSGRKIIMCNGVSIFGTRSNSKILNTPRVFAFTSNI